MEEEIRRPIGRCLKIFESSNPQDYFGDARDFISSQISGKYLIFSGASIPDEPSQISFYAEVYRT